MPHRVPEDMPDRMLEDMPDRMPEGMPDRMPDRMSDRMPEDMPDKVPECLPDRMPADLPDNMPEDMPEDMPGRMPEDMPDRMPDRLPENMSDRMPEDLPVTKCINVMVGITRSKVIFLTRIHAAGVCGSVRKRSLGKKALAFCCRRLVVIGEPMGTSNRPKQPILYGPLESSNGSRIAIADSGFSRPR